MRVAEATPKRAALALLVVRPGERVVEVGVGTGAMTVALVSGVDLSRRMVALTQ